MITFTTDEHNGVIVCKDIVKNEIIDVIPLNDGTKMLLNVMKSNTIFGIDGKIYEVVDPFNLHKERD